MAIKNIFNFLQNDITGRRGRFYQIFLTQMKAEKSSTIVFLVNFWFFLFEVFFIDPNIQISDHMRENMSEFFK